MSAITISGDTSGAVTLAAPLVAGTNTITLPATTDTMAVLGNLLGVGQTWTDVKTTPGRVSGTTYTNSTGKPIAVVVMCNTGVSTVGLTITVGGVSFGSSVNYAGTASYTARDFFIVPNGVTYVVTSNGTITNWVELR